MNISSRAKTGYHTDLSCIYRERIRGVCLLFTVYCLLFLFSCGQDVKQEVIPDNILPVEKMALVITDIHIAEAEANERILPDSAYAEKLSFRQIFDKNKITTSQYDTSISFYIDHPEMLNEVYEQVLNELSKMQAGNTGGNKQ